MKFSLLFHRLPARSVSTRFLSGALLFVAGSIPALAQHTHPLPVSMPGEDVAACHALAIPGPPCARAEFYRQQREQLFNSPVSTDLTAQILRARQIQCLDLLLGEAERECAAEAGHSGGSLTGQFTGHAPVPPARNSGNTPSDDKPYYTPDPSDPPHPGPYRAMKPHWGMSDPSDPPHPGPYRARTPRWGMSDTQSFRPFRQFCDRLFAMLQAARQRAGNDPRNLQRLLDTEERFQRLCGDNPPPGTVMMEAPPPVPHLPAPTGADPRSRMIPLPYLEPHGPHLPPRPPETPDQ